MQIEQSVCDRKEFIKEHWPCVYGRESQRESQREKHGESVLSKVYHLSLSFSLSSIDSEESVSYLIYHGRWKLLTIILNSLAFVTEIS